MRGYGYLQLGQGAEAVELWPSLATRTSAAVNGMKGQMIYPASARDLMPFVSRGFRGVEVRNGYQCEEESHWQVAWRGATRGLGASGSVTWGSRYNNVRIRYLGPLAR